MADAIFPSDVTTGKLPIVAPRSAGAVHCQRFHYVFATTQDENDILELGVLPAFCRVVDAVIVPEGTMTSRTCDIGIMSGSVGSSDTARTSGDEFFDAAALDAGVVRMSKAAGFLVAPVAYDRSVGLKLDDEMTGASTKKITLILWYIQ